MRSIHASGCDGHHSSLGFAFRPGARYLPAMPTCRHCAKDTPAKLAKRMSRRWRVVLMRNKGEILGTIETPDADAAKAAAAVQVEVGDVQRNRIIMQELA